MKESAGVALNAGRDGRAATLCVNVRGGEVVGGEVLG